MGYAEGDDAALVTDNVTLPTTAAGDVAVSWSSDKPEVISAAGAVVRPAAGEPDAAVVLTATLTKGEATDKKTFAVVVKSMTIEDRTALRQAIDAAQALLDGAVEGANPGQYPAGSKAALQAAVAAAEAAYGNSAATAQQLDDALASLASAADAFKKAVITQGPVIVPDPATPTPTPTQTPKPTPTPADGNKVVTTFNDEDLKRLSGDLVLSAAKDATRVLLPIRAADLTGNKPIRIQFNAISIELPAEVLSEAQSSAAGQPTDKTRIALEAAPVSQARAEPIQNAGLLNRAAVQVVGQMYEFSLSVTTEGNEAKKISEFAKPLTLRFALEGAVNPDLTGVYFIGGQNELQYAGGKIENNVITAQVRHFSTYAVLEINKRFNDVSESNWASPAIKSLAAKQIVNGTTETEYTPNRSVSRAEFAALLTRSLGLQSTGSNPFNDVKSDAWYADAVTAVYEAGIVTGRDPQTFEPAKTITRQEAAVMLMRAYAFQSGSRDVPAAGTVFSDQANISAWAQDAVSQASALGLLKGKGANVFMPQTSLTRAEAAQIVYALLNS
ncbi:S-layer homology domain-containing protein [Cohnella ginsengisoli]|uniref:S-layer homology domain-containing protein n=1 Tax=Cohnella ginsengisoli TaxID=425004 RepID=A0A9X4QMV9_9BACL|nr:S-layer homology domain-containing protein [Cohnella ginsengisoli]MDG0791811.1 S-layer homology domain-containing protein [Cohnella ginsengisoli]